MVRIAKSRFPGVAAAIAYAKRVVALELAAGRLAQLACVRFLTDLDAARAGNGAWEFREDLAEAGQDMAGMFPNIKGPVAGQQIQLLAWQRMVYASLYGFVKRGTDTRRFRQAVIYVPKGNGKTTFAAPILLDLTFGHGEGGAEGYTAAVTRDQARILWDTCFNMTKRSPVFRREYGVETAANAIYQPDTASKLIPISSDAKSLDGLSVAVAVCDEIASHKTAEVYQALITATGKRRHPLLLSISTATGNTSGIGKQLWDYAVRVLDGLQKDDRLFALIYTLDEGDDPWEESTWIKCNPSWGVTVQPDAIRAIMRQARNNPAQEAMAQSRHLNIWTGADEALFSMRSWRDCEDPTLLLEDFQGRDCILAVDLASKTDLAALIILFATIEPDSGKREYTAFARCYLNDAAVMEARNASYPGWAAEGHLTITPGNETDFSTIEADVLDLSRQFKVVALAYDPWAATQFAQRLAAEGVPVVEFRANMRSFSEPTKELDAAMRAGRLRHDGNPVLEWCVGNVVGHYDARGNVYPRKSRPEQKIDAAVALVMTLGTSVAKQESESRYNSGAEMDFI